MKNLLYLILCLFLTIGCGQIPPDKDLSEKLSNFKSFVFLIDDDVSVFVKHYDRNRYMVYTLDINTNKPIVIKDDCIFSDKNGNRFFGEAKFIYADYVLFDLEYIPEQ